MIHAVSAYFKTLITQFGSGWNRFWFTPADAYPLAVLRIAVGAIAFYWLASFTPDVIRFFGADAMLPSELMQTLEVSRTSFSILDYLHTNGEVWAFHVLSLIAVGLFTLGLFSRVTAVLSLVVVLSYIQRAPVLAGEAERVLALALFYLCLGPTGAALSLDRLRARRTNADQPAGSVSANIALKLLQIHVAVIYAMMALAQLGGPNQSWWLGDAVWLLAARPESRMVDLTWLLRDNLYLVNAWSHAIVLLELSFALLVWNRLARPLLLVLAVPMWVSLALISGLSTFCLLMIALLLAYVPASFLRNLARDADETSIATA